MITRQRAVAVAAAVLLSLTAAGCGLGDDGGTDDGAAAKPPPASAASPSDEPPALPSGSPGIPEGGIVEPGDVDGQDSDAVGQGALRVYYTYDTALDTSRNDAGRRMADAGWCTGTYAQALREAASRSAPGASWTEWARHRAYTTVSMVPSNEAGKPADTPTSAYRTYAVTLTPIGRDGWRGTPEFHVAYVELSRTAPNQDWRINEVAVP